MAAEAAGTAVVLVHGMGEKRPMETLEAFTKTALHPRTPGEKAWDFHPLPADNTSSYEARRFATDATDGHTEIYEYDWSFLMTANKYAGAMAAALRLFLRRPGNVPDALLGIWRYVWCVILAILLAIPVLFLVGYALNTDVPAWIIGLVISAVILIFWFGLYRMAAKALVNRTTAPLVDVARYLDPSPYSYAARRAIRGGLLNLLRALHAGRYSRIVVVSHGVGTYIAYDALAELWAERQRVQGQENRWCITDFITVGAPLALADLLLTRPPLFSGFKKSDDALRHELFEGLLHRGALVSCPNPDSEEATVLGPFSAFAVTRWTNMWFPVTRGELHGDWFGGALGPLFGQGIRDIAVQGNRPERLKRGSAHLEYFRHPDKGDEGDLAWHLRHALDL